MKKFNAVVISTVAVFGTSGALAQTGAPATADAPSTSQPAEAEAQGETKVSITPQDIDNFAKAVIKVNQIEADASLDQAQKQTAMNAAVENSGLEPYKFNTIVQASQTHPELKQRVQLAIAQRQQQ